jgi:hypothetical protein
VAKVGSKEAKEKPIMEWKEGQNESQKIGLKGGKREAIKERR